MYSAIIIAWAKALGYQVIDLPLSKCDMNDFIGYPVLDKPKG